MDSTVRKHIIIQETGDRGEFDLELVAEEPLEIRVNGAPYAVVMRTPGYEIELAAGFCFTEGIVNSFSEILTIGFCADTKDNMQNIINVMVKTAEADGECGKAADLKLSSGRRYESRSSCGLCGVQMIEDVYKEVQPVESGMRVRAADIFAMNEAMSERQELGRRTRATHAAALFRPDGEPIVVREDVGRHNALDRVIGHALLNGINCGGCVAFLSSRISFEMAQKAARAQIPVVAAVSAATSLAVALAERANCTLVGRVRDKSMILYTHPERIIQ